MASYFPPEWNDDERMRVLMGPMPYFKDGVAMKGRITFWSAALQLWTRSKEGLCFTVNEAMYAFRRGTQVPLCLPQVIQHLLNQGDLITYEDLIKPINSHESWFGWGRRILISNPSKWALNFLYQTPALRRNFETEVLIDNRILKEKCDKLLSTYWGTSKTYLSFDPEGVISEEDLFRCVKTAMELTLEDLNIMLHYLHHKKLVTIVEHRGKTLVKLSKPGQSEISKIDEMEIAEYQLRSTEILLEERLKTLQEETSKLRERAKYSVRIGSKAQAMSYLRRKKRCDASAKNIIGSLENVSNCLHQIQESKLNLDVLNSFQTGMTALRMSIASTGGTEKASATMDTLQELLEECNDISDVLASGVSPYDNVVDSDLERELRELELDPLYNTSNYSQGDKVTQQLPDVPKNNPLSPSKRRESEMDVS
ncbi:Charged multivesicular body protein 7 [Armadillidium nasatum]|uniref:Charged multivesicular body protein 7 n=1 Tax=Armadillidium nasatum TaxID=96803 RepID=A0A5N5SXY0_9CRUS|nr:Charged multivesicular body protein 7 [Armadillidium nasatum]